LPLASDVELGHRTIWEALITASTRRTPDDAQRRFESFSRAALESILRACARRGDCRRNLVDRDGVMIAGNYTRAVKTRAAVVLMMAMAGGAAAEGERTPLFGVALTYSDVPDHRAALVGGEVELAWWSGRLGLAVEAAARHAVDDSAGNVAVAGSARVLVADWLWSSLVEPRDVEMGVELQLIGERMWWSGDDRADAYGLGAAIRMRGGSDWEFSSLLAESRLFVRVMRSGGEPPGIAARTADAVVEQPGRGTVTVMVGLGAAFGTGDPRYLDRFRLRAFEAPRP
jgi:hypothetical protein